eukprot:5417192-Pleurochrysis_carterae.AAC.2
MIAPSVYPSLCRSDLGNMSRCAFGLVHRTDNSSACCKITSKLAVDFYPRSSAVIIQIVSKTIQDRPAERPIKAFSGRTASTRRGPPA